MSVMNRVQSFSAMLMDRFIKVKPVKRSCEDQISLDRESRRIQLYFCKNSCSSIKVKRRCAELGLRVVEKDVQRVDAYRNELLLGGGELKVPCLRIEGIRGKDTSWLYDSESILNYLERRFPA